MALPVVLLLLTQLTAKREHLSGVVLELLAGVAIGIVVPWLGIRLEASRFFKAVGLFQPLSAFAIGLLVLAICYRFSANLFLGTCAAGISISTFSSAVADSFERFGELIAELLKLAALLVFGAMISPNLFRDMSVWDYVFTVLATFAVRPPSVILSLAGTRLTWHEKFIAGWFGPKGFASVVYGLLILQGGQVHLAHVVGLAVVTSVLVFSSTDILIGQWFEQHGMPKSGGGNLDG